MPKSKPTRPTYEVDADSNIRWPNCPPRIIQTNKAGDYEVILYLDKTFEGPVLHLRRYWCHPFLGRIATSQGIEIKIDSPETITRMINYIENLYPRLEEITGPRRKRHAPRF